MSSQLILEPEQDTVQVSLTREQFTEQLIDSIRSGKTRLSYSAISKFKRSPKCFIDYKLAPKEQTDAMLLGSIVHCLILEPEHFDERYVSDAEIIAEIGGAKPRATTRYKEWKSEQTGSIVISADFHKAGQDMANAVLNNSAAKWVLDQCDKHEFKIEWTHQGLRFIGFIDAKGRVIADIKICQDAEPKKFQRDIINMGYYLQAGSYTVASEEMLPYFLIAVDRNHGVSVHEVTEDLIEFGMNEFDRLCVEFNKCLDANDFHKSFEYRSQTDQGYFKVSKPPYL